MSEIPIEKNVPIPRKVRKPTFKMKLRETIRKMQKGDSILLPSGSQTAAREAAWFLGARVTCAKEGKLIRVWRVS